MLYLCDSMSVVYVCNFKTVMLISVFFFKRYRKKREREKLLFCVPVLFMDYQSHIFLKVLLSLTEKMQVWNSLGGSQTFKKIGWKTMRRMWHLYVVSLSTVAFRFIDYQIHDAKEIFLHFMVLVAVKLE